MGKKILLSLLAVLGPAAAELHKKKIHGDCAFRAFARKLTGPAQP